MSLFLLCSGLLKSLSVLDLVCLETPGPQQVPVITGTNASLFQCLTAFCGKVSNSESTHSFRILSQCVGCDIPSLDREKKTLDWPKGVFKWVGLCPFSVPSRGERYAGCRVACQKLLNRGIFLMETSPDETMPAEFHSTCCDSFLTLRSVNCVLIHGERFNNLSIPQNCGCTCLSWTQ